VRNALVMGRGTTSRPGRDPPPHPDDWDAEHILLRTVRCVSAVRGAGDELRACVRLPRGPPPGSIGGSVRRGIARAGKNPEAHPPRLRLTQPALGLEGPKRGQHRSQRGRQRLRRTSWSKHPARRLRGSLEKMWKTSESWRQWINIATSPTILAGLLSAQCLDAHEGLPTPRRALLAATHVASGTPQGERNWDYTLRMGCVTLRSRCGVCTRWAWTVRPTLLRVHRDVRAPHGDATT